jgi:hypothetical protein
LFSAYVHSLPKHIPYEILNGNLAINVTGEDLKEDGSDVLFCTVPVTSSIN